MDPQGTVGSQEGDSLSDIQSYLVNFNKEICSGSQGYVLTSAIQQKSAQNAYVVANAENQLYDGNILHDVSEENVTTLKTEESEKKTKLERSEQQLLGQEETIFEARNAKMSSEASADDLLRAVTNGDTAPSLITIQPDQCAVSGPDSANTRQQANVEQDDGSNTYQTVTIVPSEVNQGGEVSYVLIVSQNEHQSKAADDVDMSVYDFKEENRTNLETNADHGDRNTTRKSYRTSMGRKPAVQMSSQLMCNYCNYTSSKKYLLTRHMKTHSDERPHKCHICERAFKTVASLQNHINTHTGVHPHKCKECDAAFTTSGELVRHVRYRHTYEKPHRCPECDYASVELSKLKRHMRSHTGERPYQCPHCVYASPDTYKLKRHLRIHTGEKPYECDICHTRFTQSNSLKAHRLIHTGEKPVYQCELCPTTCSRKTDLKFHVRKLHTSDTPLQCKKCGKSFPDRYTWKIHLKTHEGEKCFRCELCPYAALSQRHLESHLLTHTGEKPFECDQCEMSFRQKQLLKRHKNLYHNPDYVPPTPKDKIHQCPDCDKSFAHKGNLLRHRAGHDPDNQEYQQALENYRAEQGEEYDEEAEEEDEQDQSMSEDLIVRQAVIGDGQLYETENIGQVHLANINGQQVQLQLVNLNDENNTQVYIQIDDNQQLDGLVDNDHLSGENAGLSTPTGHQRQQIEPRQINIKQEAMEQEDHSQGHTIVADQYVTGSRNKRASDYMENPSKRLRMDSPRKSNQTEQDEIQRKRDWTKKDIETCFGFDDI